MNESVFGEKVNEVHARAHQLEPVDRGATLEYLDTLLKHPQKDPHGQNIPSDQSTSS
jgi:Mn-dependent DtxR family transcriptional regulator